MEQILLEEFYRNIYHLSIDYNSYSKGTGSSVAEVNECIVRIKTLKYVLDRCGIVYSYVYQGYLGNKIDIANLDKYIL